MYRYIIRRLLILPVVLLGLSIIIFGMLMLLSPVERAALYVTSVPKNPVAIQEIIKKYGLDQPIYDQYGRWLNNIIHGDLGWSKTAQMPVIQAIKTFFPATLELALWSFVPIIVEEPGWEFRQPFITTPGLTRQPVCSVLSDIHFPLLFSVCWS